MLWLAIKPFYMSVCKHGFRSSSISYFIEEMLNGFRVYIAWNVNGNHFNISSVQTHGNMESICYKIKEKSFIKADVI